MQQRSVVITGATGLVGTKLVQRMLTLDDMIHAVVHRPLPTKHPVLGVSTTARIKLHTVDLADDRLDWTWMEAAQPSTVIHCAAMTNVDECERSPTSADAINEHATRSLAEACVRCRAHLMMVSTDYVFDGSDERPGPYREDDAVCPVNHYGRSKWHGEIAVRDVCEGKTAWTICRTSVVYGFAPWTRANFATWLLERLRNGESTSIVNDQVSSPTLSDDLADMLIELMRRRIVGVFHTAGSTVIDRYQFALALAKQIGLDSSLIKPVTTSELRQVAPRPLKAGLRIEKVKQKLGFVPLSLDEGLSRFIEAAST